ncbi:MAG TPA: Wzz/FepE/Etk N-terminal domain-containing protein [Candidatus Acidoferrum sp.]|nr:Wzz/FepE/Etk N-terminal domain-containing protein [Candidatus Acidoferrum sp.]
MVRDGEIAAEDAKRVLRRFWWIIAITVITGGSMGMAAAMVLPKKYTSQTLILVQQPGVPSDIVKPVVTEDLNHRLASMQEQILSRSRLEPIIEKLGLFPELHGKVHTDDAVELLRTSITVTPLESMPGTQHQGLPGFFVKVTFPVPRLAQQICSDITSMFMEQNERASEQQAKRTTTFLQQELADAKAKIDEQDAKLAQFKRKNLGILPEETQANLSLLMGMNSQLEANTQALNRAQQDKAFNESLLNEQLANWEASLSTPGKNPETLEQQLNALQDQLAMLQARYTAEHPDVIKLKRSVEEVKKRIKDAAKVTAPASESAQTLRKEPPQIQQLRVNLHQNEVSIEELTKRQAQIQKQIGVLQARVEESPIVEQQLKELTRNHQSALDFYNELLKELNHSSMTSDLQQQQEGEHFSVLDPPSLPDRPSFPKKLNFIGGGLGGGFALGLGILGLILINDKSIYTERDVELCLKLPVLGLIPNLGAATSARESAAQAEAKYIPVSTRV